MARPRNARSGWIAAGVLVALALTPPVETLASCQTEWCHQDFRLREREREVAARAAVASAPDDADAVRQLIAVLAGKVGREQAIATYEARYRWEPPPDMASLEAEVAAERRRLSVRLLGLERDDPRAVCDYARELAGGEERVEMLRQRLEERPSEGLLVVCLARVLVGLDRRDAALAALRAFLVDHPERVVADELVELLGKDEAGVLAVREAMAMRRPDDLDSQLRLLDFLTEKERLARYEQRASKLVNELIASVGTQSDHRSICRAIDLRATDLRQTCWERLYTATLGEEESEELVRLRRDVLESLVGIAFHARDWPRLAGLLARVAVEDLPSTWSRIVDFTRGEYCPQFVAAFDRGIEWSEQWQARRLIGTLRECGEEERARVLVEGAGLLREDGSDLTSSPGIEGLRESWCPRAEQALRQRSSFTGLAVDAGGRLLVAFEEWAREEPENTCAWLGLATLHERAGDVDAALSAWNSITDLAPANLDLVVLFGAVALRLDRPAAVRSAADRLRRDPNAVPRHHAEADYLLGRLARREGRWEEASDLLASYFLRRMEFVGCPVRACDRSLLLHLVEAGDVDRLARYVTARKALVAACLEPLPADSKDPRERIRRARLHHAFELDEAVLTLDCVSPRALARLEQQSASAPADEDLKRRLAGLRARRPCSAEELPDPEPLFPDDELLALSWTLREVD